MNCVPPIKSSVQINDIVLVGVANDYGTDSRTRYSTNNMYTVPLRVIALVDGKPVVMINGKGYLTQPDDVIWPVVGQYVTVSRWTNFPANIFKRSPIEKMIYHA